MAACPPCRSARSANESCPEGEKEAIEGGGDNRTEGGGLEWTRNEDRGEGGKKEEEEEERERGKEKKKKKGTTYGESDKELGHLSISWIYANRRPPSRLLTFPPCLVVSPLLSALPLRSSSCPRHTCLGLLSTAFRRVSLSCDDTSNETRGR